MRRRTICRRRPNRSRTKSFALEGRATERIDENGMPRPSHLEFSSADVVELVDTLL